jgi:organic radical activating enzyme
MDGRKLLEIKPNKPYLDVVWQVSNFCNYKCSYCNPGNYCGDSRNDDNLITYIQNLEVITNKYRELGYENFKFFFSGGEPTLWRNLVPIIEWIRERNLQPRGKDGRFQQKTDKNIKGMAFGIQKNIKKYGIRPANFIDISIEKIMEDPRIVELIGDQTYDDLIDSLSGI